jgi:uncharacterized delta-60 repeat protein
MKYVQSLTLAFSAFFFLYESHAQVLDAGYTSIFQCRGNPKTTAHGNNILVYGEFDHLNGSYQGRLLFLDQQGQLVDGFQPIFADGIISHLKVLSSGKILIAGPFTEINGAPSTNLVLLNSDGTIDESFHSDLENVWNIELQSGDRIVAVHGSTMSRLNPDGSVDETFTFNPFVTLGQYTLIAVGPDDEVCFTWNAEIRRVSENGDTDAAFAIPEIQYGINKIGVFPDGEILVGGYFSQVNGVAAGQLIRLNKDGTLDSDFTYGSTVNGNISDFLINDDGSILAAGYLQVNSEQFKLVELNNNGIFVKRLADTYIFGLTAIARTADSKVITAGIFSSINGADRFGIALLENGLVDEDFRPVLTYNQPQNKSITVNSNGSSFLVGFDPGEGVYADGEFIPTTYVQLDPEGNPDMSFEPFDRSYHIYSALIDSDDRVVVTSLYNPSTPQRVFRFFDDGAPDETLNMPGSETQTNTITYGSKEHNGKLFFAGRFSNFYGHATRGLIALNEDGSVNQLFTSLPENSRATDIEFQSDGRIIVLGYFPNDASRIVRLYPDGTLDSTFPVISNNNGGAIRDVAIDSDDRLYLAGSFHDINGTPINHLTRLTKDGAIDPTFNIGSGFGDEGWGPTQVRVLPDESILIGGYFEFLQGSRCDGIARLSDTGELIPMPEVDFGNTSVITSMNFSNNALYAAGRFVKNDYSNVSATAKIDFTFIVPVAPQSLLASEYGNVIRLSWEDHSDHETQFVVQRSIFPDKHFSTIIRTPNDQTQTYDSSAIDGTTYYYRVRAINRAGFSAWSNVVTNVPSAPASPSDVSTKIQGGAIVIQWADNSWDESSFIIERSGNSGTTEFELAANSATFTDNNVDTGIEYQYRVRARNMVGSSGWSNPSLITIPKPVPPVAPTSLQVSQLSSLRFHLTWTDNAGNETGFVIERFVVGRPELYLTDTLESDVESYIDGSIAASIMYNYRVLATNADGVSASNSFSIMYVIPLPNPPSAVVATFVKRGVFSVQWQDNSDNETGFALERAVANNDFELFRTFNQNTISFYDSTIAYGLTYSYRVRSENVSGGSDWSLSAGITWTETLETPASLTVESSAQGIAVIKWNDVSDEDYYSIVRTSPGQDTKTFTVQRDDTLLEDSVLSPNVEYTYRVMAVNNYVTSAWSTAVMLVWPVPPIVWPVPPSAPTGLTANLENNKVMIAWVDNSSGELSFVIERAVGNSPFSFLLEAGANVHAFTDMAEQFGVKYTYRVKAVSDAGSSSWSNEASVTWNPAPAGELALQIAEIADGVFELKWEGVEYQQGFVVERSLGNNKKYEVIDSLNSAADTYLDTLGAMQAYYYRVSAFNASGVVKSNEIWLLITGDERQRSESQAYPNPATDVVYLQTPTTVVEKVKVFNSHGGRVNPTIYVTGNVMLIDISELAGGFYLIEIPEHGTTRFEKFLKK